MSSADDISPFLDLFAAVIRRLKRQLSSQELQDLIEEIAEPGEVAPPPSVDSCSEGR